MKILATIGQPSAIRFGASFRSTAVLSALAPDTIFAPGSNTIGAYLWKACMLSVMAGTNRCAIIAAASAPSTLTTSDVLALGLSNGGSVPGIIQIDEPVFIRPGLGLYMISENLETLAYRSALYTILA